MQKVTSQELQELISQSPADKTHPYLHPPVKTEDDSETSFLESFASTPPISRTSSVKSWYDTLVSDKIILFLEDYDEDQKSAKVFFLDREPNSRFQEFIVPNYDYCVILKGGSFVTCKNNNPRDAERYLSFRYYKYPNFEEILIEVEGHRMLGLKADPLADNRIFFLESGVLNLAEIILDENRFMIYPIHTITETGSDSIIWFGVSNNYIVLEQKKKDMSLEFYIKDRRKTIFNQNLILKCQSNKYSQFFIDNNGYFYLYSKLKKKLQIVSTDNKKLKRKKENVFMVQQSWNGNVFALIDNKLYYDFFDNEFHGKININSSRAFFANSTKVFYAADANDFLDSSILSDINFKPYNCHENKKEPISTGILSLQNYVEKSLKTFNENMLEINNSLKEYKDFLYILEKNKVTLMTYNDLFLC